MFNEERESHEDERLYMERVKEQLKQFGQEQNFMNKRKAEYLELLKQPCYRETNIRVKLPNNWVWECTFSPLETLQTLVQIFHEVPLTHSDSDRQEHGVLPLHDASGAEAEGSDSSEDLL